MAAAVALSSAFPFLNRKDDGLKSDEVIAAFDRVKAAEKWFGSFNKKLISQTAATREQVKRGRNFAFAMRTQGKTFASVLEREKEKREARAAGQAVDEDPDEEPEEEDDDKEAPDDTSPASATSIADSRVKLGECMNMAGAYGRQFEDSLLDLDKQLSKTFDSLMSRKLASNSKKHTLRKEYERELSAYRSALSKYESRAAKKNPNKDKLQEAEEARDAAKASFDKTAAAALQELNDFNAETDTLVCEMLLSQQEAYHTFFLKGLPLASEAYEVLGRRIHPDIFGLDKEEDPEARRRREEAERLTRLEERIRLEMSANFALAEAEQRLAQERQLTLLREAKDTEIAELVSRAERLEKRLARETALRTEEEAVGAAFRKKMMDAAEAEAALQEKNVKGQKALEEKLRLADEAKRKREAEEDRVEAEARAKAAEAAKAALPVCRACDKKVEGKYVSAVGYSWHKECWVCTHCKETLTKYEYHAATDRPYCPKHYDELFADMCPGCNKPLDGAVLEAMGSEWHEECFVCFRCKGSLDDGFVRVDNKPCCDACEKK